jgi:A/G-specific adenine glycosylase
MTDSSVDQAKTERLRSLAVQQGLTPEDKALFRELVWDFYRRHGRAFPWRETSDPYRILVSEVMLQQTSTSRVLGKYEDFLAVFPDFEALAAAPVSNLLQVWQGLGYNRRALALQRTAIAVLSEFEGELPSDPAVLRRLPGIGPYTASAIAALAFNKPAVFIETNIRAVFLHLFFPECQAVDDRELLPLVAETLDEGSPREWYYALFDYGAHLKKSLNPGVRSAQYHRQAPFKGSNRELRGRILRALLARGSLQEAELLEELEWEPAQVRSSVRELEKEGFLTVSGTLICTA